MHRPDTTPGKTALILGASGKFGRNAAQAFGDRGWQIRRFDRKRDDLMLAAQGVDVIVNGWNPPSYNLWAKELLPAHQSVARAAKASGATVIIPGNVYNFGPDAPRGWSETTPHLATNPLGRLRIAVEQGYRDAQVQTIVLRAGDFWDTARSQNWFDLFIAKKAHRGVMSYPGDLDTPHAWAFLPDLARAAVLLAERREAVRRARQNLVRPGPPLPIPRPLSYPTKPSIGHRLRAPGLPTQSMRLTDCSRSVFPDVRIIPQNWCSRRRWRRSPRPSQATDRFCRRTSSPRECCRTRSSRR